MYTREIDWRAAAAIYMMIHEKRFAARRRRHRTRYRYPRHHPAFGIEVHTSSGVASIEVYRCQRQAAKVHHERFQSVRSKITRKCRKWTRKRLKTARIKCLARFFASNTRTYPRNERARKRDYGRWNDAPFRARPTLTRTLAAQPLTNNYLCEAKIAGA